MPDMTQESPTEITPAAAAPLAAEATPAPQAAAAPVTPAAEATPNVVAADASQEPGADAAAPGDAQDKPKRKPRPKRRPVEAVVTAIAGEWVLVSMIDGTRGATALSQFVAPPAIDAKLTLLITGKPGEDGLVPMRVPPPPPPPVPPSPWKTLKRGDLVEGHVSGMNIGGLELKVLDKIKAFMPLSHIELTPVEDLTPYLKQNFPCVILEVDRRNRKLILSRRVIMEREVRKNRVHAMKVGDILEGKIRKIENFGVFVDLGDGLDGLVRLPDLSWKPFEDPNEVAKVGDVVKVRLLGIDHKRGRLGLGVRQANPDPWTVVGEKYKAGMTIKGKVTRTAEFGAFVELEPGIEGLIHISQLSERRVEKVEQAVRVGMEVEAKVTECDAKRHRVSLSIRALTAPEAAATGAEASKDEMKKYVKSKKNAHAMESLMAKFGGGGLKGGIG